MKAAAERRPFCCDEECPIIRSAFAALSVGSLLRTSPASAVTNENGDVPISQTAVNAGDFVPGDAPGFAVTISLPGTNRLATNLTVTAAVNGIEVRANEVTIEMGGRTFAGSGVGRNGITSFNRGLAVRNGPRPSPRTTALKTTLHR
jgi:hypothetical protein